MSEAVEILIKADDQASQKFAESSTNMVQSMKRAEQILNQLQDPAERYAKQLAEIELLHKSGALSAEQFAAAQTSLSEKMSRADNSIKEVGEKTKVTTEFVGSLAAMLGGTEFASFASQAAGMTEKVGQFSEVANSGGAGALAFKLGVVSLAAGLGAMVGKALGDVIFKTKAFERETQRAKQAAADFDERVKSLQSNLMQQARADVEIIKDPEKKKAAYAALLEKLNKDVEGVTAQVKGSEKAVEEWANRWQITGDQKEFAKQSQEQLDIDRERLKAVRAERDEILRLTGAREAERQAIAAANEAKENSSEFLNGLRAEIELLKASKEEQLQIEAARNTTTEDRGEAEKLLKERDAIIAKLEAEKELEQERQRAAEQAVQQAEQEQQRVSDLIKSEQERLELRKIEIEKGKEAAKVQSLINQGVDEATAKKIAADEAALEQLTQKGSKGPSALQASESRLLTRGDSSGPLDKTNQILEQTQRHTEELAKFQAQQLEQQRRIAENTSKTTSVTVPV